MQLRVTDMRAEVMIKVPAVTMPGANTEMLTGVRISVVTIAIIGLKFFSEITYAAELLPGVRASASISGASGVGAEVGADGLTVVTLALELL